MREETKNAPFFPKNSGWASFEDVERALKTKFDFLVMWFIVKGVVVCCLSFFLYSPVNFFTGNLAWVCAVCVMLSFWSSTRSTSFLRTLDRFMRSFVSEKLPVARNAVLCVFESVKNLFKRRSWWTPSDPTHPIRRVLPAQKKGTCRKILIKNTCNTWEGGREVVITKLLFEKRHHLWALVLPLEVSLWEKMKYFQL